MAALIARRSWREPRQRPRAQAGRAVRGLAGWRLAVWGVALAVACNDGVQGLDAPSAPLATLRIQLAPGTDIADLQRPRVALLWAGQAIIETACWDAALTAALGLPADATVAAVMAQGCRDPLGVVPAGPGESAPLAADGSADLSLWALPSAAYMVGDVSARIAHATVILYDDRDGDGSFRVQRPAWPRAGEGEATGGPGSGGGGPGGGGDGHSGDEPMAPDEFEESLDDGVTDGDIVVAASFVSMTQPDVRVTFREGGFDALSAFYPRAGCPAPPLGYAVLSADGFALIDAVSALADGQLPTTSGCAASAFGPTAPPPIVLTRRPLAALRGVGCAIGSAASADGRARYREPPDKAPWLSTSPWVCRPAGGGGAPGALAGGEGGEGGAGGKPGDPGAAAEELIVPYPTSSCPGLRHYVLRGCRNDARCDQPDWDRSAHPPSWWPCAAAARP